MPVREVFPLAIFGGRPQLSAIGADVALNDNVVRRGDMLYNELANILVLPAALWCAAVQETHAHWTHKFDDTVLALKELLQLLHAVLRCAIFAEYFVVLTGEVKLPNEDLVGVDWHVFISYYASLYCKHHTEFVASFY